MRSNRELLEELFATGAIRAQRGPIFDQQPILPAEPLDFDRVEGMMLGLAIGDALGNPSESAIPAHRAAEHGEIREYRPKHGDPTLVGVPSDDSQLAFWTLEHLLEHGGLVPDRLAHDFSRRRIFGLGASVKEFLENVQAGVPWHQAGADSAGNGALMRIAPVIIPHLQCPSQNVWSDVALAAMLTHNDPASTAACVALASLLWQLVSGSSPVNRHEMLEQFVEVARTIEGETSYCARGGDFKGKEFPVWKFTGEVVRAALAKNLSTLDACNSWHSGAFLLETVPSVLFILMRYLDEPEEALIRSVNDTKDNDTVAAIVGAVVGARHGTGWIPSPWRAGLRGCTTADDDGRVFELLAQARERWG